MNSVDSRAPFFPRSKNNHQAQLDKLKETALKRNSNQRAKELKDIGEDHAKIQIPDAIKDFSRIKKAVDMAPPIDNSEKIARLKQQIQEGSYEIDHEAVADRLLASEM